MQKNALSTKSSFFYVSFISTDVRESLFPPRAFNVLSHTKKIFLIKTLESTKEKKLKMEFSVFHSLLLLVVRRFKKK